MTYFPVQSQTATRNAKTEIDILQRVDHVSNTNEEEEKAQVQEHSFIASNSTHPSFPPCLLQPCLIKTEDFYQTEESFYIVLELCVKLHLSLSPVSGHAHTNTLSFFSLHFGLPSKLRKRSVLKTLSPHRSVDTLKHRRSKTMAHFSHVTN